MDYEHHIKSILNKVNKTTGFLRIISVTTLKTFLWDIPLKKSHFGDNARKNPKNTVFWILQKRK